MPGQPQVGAINQLTNDEPSFKDLTIVNPSKHETVDDHPMNVKWITTLDTDLVKELHRRLDKVAESRKDSAKYKNFERAIKTITESDPSFKEMPDNVVYSTRETNETMEHTEEKSTELNENLAKENDNLRKTVGALFKENQALRNELNMLNVILLRKVAKEVGVEFRPEQST